MPNEKEVSLLETIRQLDSHEPSVSRKQATELLAYIKHLEQRFEVRPGMRVVPEDQLTVRELLDWIAAAHQLWLTDMGHTRESALDKTRPPLARDEDRALVFYIDGGLAVRLLETYKS